MLQVSVHYNGDLHSVEVEPDATVADIGTSLQEQCGEDTNGNMELYFGETCLEPHARISDSGITSESMLTAVNKPVLKLKWLPEPEPNRHFMFTDDGYTMYCRGCSSHGGSGIRTEEPIPPGTRKWFMRISANHGALGVTSDPSAAGFFRTSCGAMVGVGVTGDVKVSDTLTSSMTLSFEYSYSEKVLKYAGVDNPAICGSLAVPEGDKPQYIVAYPAHRTSISILDDPKAPTTTPDD